MPGEIASDESGNFRPEQNFKINTFSSILDSALISIEERFVPNKDLYKDCARLNPEQFKDISNFSDITEFPENAFIKLSELTGVNRVNILVDLKRFAYQYDALTAECRKKFR